MQQMPPLIDFSDPNIQLLFAVVGLVIITVLMVLSIRASRRTEKSVEERLNPLSMQMQFMNQTVRELGASHQQLSGGLSHVTEMQIASQTQTMRVFEERLEELTKKMGDSLHMSAQRTAGSLGELQQRLEAIDKAQTNIEKLSGDVLGLQDILSNKQARGAFGEIQLNDIIRKAMPPDAYTFQAKLSNDKRVDCLLRLPNPPGSIAVDAKFPLEAYEQLQAATNDREKLEAARLFKSSVLKHIKDISERYIIDGETADSAMLFLPSEAVYAELHANFREVVQEGFARRVWIVSPTTLMAVLNTMRAILKDAQMREQAGAIRNELTMLYKDVERLVGRVENLDRHFGQASKDINEIKISAEKAGTRARRLESFEFDPADTAEIEGESAPLLRAISESKAG